MNGRVNFFMALELADQTARVSPATYRRDSQQDCWIKFRN